MFSGKNSVSSVATQEDPSLNKTLKIFVQELDADRVKAYRETLYKFLEIKVRADELRTLYLETLKEMDKITRPHQVVVTELYDHLCKKLALLGYNEFRHKVHVDADGKVFIIDKDVVIKREDM
jgi:hypothetical protein